jgi:release factor glutamine methyltransferase
VDASKDALQVARENAQRLGIASVRFLQSDWFSALDGQSFDLIVSNPPYIAAGDVHLTQGDVRFEPMSALASGADGLDDIRRIVSQAGGFLEQGAWLLLEHGYDQVVQVREILRQNGFMEIFSKKDIAGIDRVSGGVILRKPATTGNSA